MKVFIAQGYHDKFTKRVYYDSLRDLGAKYAGKKMPRRFQNFSVCLGNTSAKETAKDSAETFIYYVGNGFGIPRHIAKGYGLLF